MALASHEPYQLAQYHDPYVVHLIISVGYDGLPIEIYAFVPVEELIVEIRFAMRYNLVR